MRALCKLAMMLIVAAAMQVTIEATAAIGTAPTLEPNVANGDAEFAAIEAAEAQLARRNVATRWAVRALLDP